MQKLNLEIIDGEIYANVNIFSVILFLKKNTIQDE